LKFHQGRQWLLIFQELFCGDPNVFALIRFTNSFSIDPVFSIILEGTYLLVKEWKIVFGVLSSNIDALNDLFWRDNWRFGHFNG
jgi:hypothetical protein